ncbi:PQQ-binding-like beta-propeller repeat protein [Cohnella suwonensis]|uniref:PQQ-binding-like beta-propeller repeat protein n=1 Tax=Cohnella suwonensis TaxID=696072 RepID=A0ABW0M0D4_9BACL
MKRPFLEWKWLFALLLFLLLGCSSNDVPVIAHQEIWKVQTGGRMTSSPLLADGIVYFGSDDKQFYAVDGNTGEPIWRFAADDKIRSSPRVSGNNIIFQSHAGSVYAVDARTGSLQWTFATSVRKGEQDEWDYYDSSASVDGEALYIGSADSHLYAVRAATGYKLWSFKADGPIKSSPVHDADTVYFGDWSGMLYAVDKKDGQLRWSYRTPPNGRHVAIQSTPEIHDGVLYAGARNFNFYAFEAKTGKKLWEQLAPAWVASPVYRDGTLFVGNSNGDYMSGVDPQSGKEKWKFTTDSNVLAASAYEQGTLYFGSGYAYETGNGEANNLYAVDARTGQLEWKLQTGKIQSTPAIAADIVYYTGFDGALHAIAK